MAHSNPRAQRPKLYALVASLGLCAELFGCSLLLNEEAAQCSQDSDCVTLGFGESVCDTSAGICSSPQENNGSNVGDGDGDMSSGGAPVVPGSGGSGSGGSGSGGSNSPGTGGKESTGGHDGLHPTVRAIGAAMTLLYGGTGSGAFADTCPHNQVLIGLNVWTNPGTSIGSDFIQQSQGVCGKLEVAADSLSVIPGSELRVRGLGFSEGEEEMTALLCGPDEVVVGFDGNAGFYVEKVRVFCAPLSIADSGDGLQIVVGEAAPGASVQKKDSGGEAFSSLCPEGQVARGPAVRGGGWLDAFGTICTTPTVAYPLGEPCNADAECTTGKCDGECVASPCTSPIGCECVLFNSTNYVFCPQRNLFSAAAAACENVGLDLVRIENTVENGWLRNTADTLGMDAFYIGASDQAVEGEWRWRDGTQFWQGDTNGAAVDGLYEFWDSLQPSASGNCATVSSAPNIGGTWFDSPCTKSENFVCK